VTAMIAYEVPYNSKMDYGDDGGKKDGELGGRVMGFIVIPRAREEENVVGIVGYLSSIPPARKQRTTVEAVSR